MVLKASQASCSLYTVLILTLQPEPDFPAEEEPGSGARRKPEPTAVAASFLLQLQARPLVLLALVYLNAQQAKQATKSIPNVAFQIV